MIYVFTTCALNYYPNAVLLTRSLEKHLPGARRVVCLVDRPTADVDPVADGFHEVYDIGEIARNVPNLRHWIFQHTVMELATAAKPFVLADLLAREDCEAVLFFDPDCELFSDCAVVTEAVRSHSVVLTPHSCLPHSVEPWVYFELNQHRVGVFNGGFLAVRADEEGRRFATWWRNRLTEYCLIDDRRRLFTDQKWLDLIPCYFDDVKVLRRPTLNVARWNTFQRRIERQGGVLTVDGAPADFLHYSGFLKKGSYVRGLYDAKSAEWCNDTALLDSLSEDYAERLAPYQDRPACQRPWGFGLYDDGVAIPDAHRRTFQQAPQLRATFADPFAGGADLRAVLEERLKSAPLAPKPAAAPKKARRRGLSRIVRRLLGRG